MSKQTRRPRTAQKTVPLRLPLSDYQPSKAELKEEFDTPGLSREEAQRLFVRPFRFEPAAGNE